LSIYALLFAHCLGDLHMSSARCRYCLCRGRATVPLIVLSCFVSVAYVISRFTGSTSSLLHCHVFRRPNSDIVKHDGDVAERLAGLVQRRATASDPELIELIRDMMDPPSNHMIKMSRRLANTPQSQEIDRIFKKKVLHVLLLTVTIGLIPIT